MKPLAEVLAGRTLAELITLIEQMVSRYPDLEEMVMLATVVSTPDAGEAVVEIVRRQVRQALDFSGYGDLYTAASNAAFRLSAIERQARVYMAQGELQTACLFLTTLINEVLAEHERIYDGDDVPQPPDHDHSLRLVPPGDMDRTARPLHPHDRQYPSRLDRRYAG